MAKINKLDLKKELRYLYAPSRKNIELVDVPQFRYAMVDGQLEPNQTPASSLTFQNAMQALYGISFTLKFKSKMRKSNPIDYTVMALEGLWWTKADEFDFDKSKVWNFTVMIMQPEHITQEMFRDALRELHLKKDNPALSQLRFEPFNEGLCIQTMHIGPYDQELGTIERMGDFAEENELEYCGKHHEIYVGDPRRCKPERLRTIIRRPVRKKANQ